MSRTRIVRWLRVLLPLLALALLSTMFLFSRGSDIESRIPYAEIDAREAARGNRIVAPEYSGVTDDGAEVTLRAARAMPGSGGSGGGARAGELALDWLRPDGLRADLTAPEGGLSDGLVRLEGGVRMTTSTGWQMDAPRIEARTDAAVIEAGEGVEAVAPFGRITAGRMRLAPADGSGSGSGAGAVDGEGTGGGASDAAVLNFSDGVRLMYQP